VDHGVRTDDDVSAEFGVGTDGARRVDLAGARHGGPCDHSALAVGTFIDPSARFEAKTLGDGSRVLAYVHVGSEAKIAQDCVLNDHAVVLGDVVLENDVEVQAGARLLGRVHLEQGVTVGADAVIYGEGPPGHNESGEVIVRRFASIGPNVTVSAGVVVGRRAVVEAGAVVRQSVPANAIVSGNPATIVSYVDSVHEGEPVHAAVPASRVAGAIETRVRGVTLHALTSARDLRGSLMAAEFTSLPFAPRRLFTVYDVPSESVRGAHAHRECAQFLVCLAGEVSCLVDDGSAREAIELDTPEVGLHIPPMVWGTQWKYTRDAVLLVLASHPYDSDDYVRDYEEFLIALRERA
jgi:UDP-2-acetamido-3-amino-2,3-dideoxy-glucuronate N-acetyltransferase